MITQSFIAWIFSLLVALAPPAKLAALPAYPGWAETAEARTARMWSIAEDIAAVAESPAEAAALVAIAWHESAFAADVDKGPCYRGPKGDGARCDAGRAASMWQLQGDAAERAKLFAERRYAARRARDLMRRSARACVQRHGREAALRVYASGTCRLGVRESADMVRLARRLLAEHPLPRAGSVATTDALRDGLTGERPGVGGHIVSDLGAGFPLVCADLLEL